MSNVKPSGENVSRKVTPAISTAVSSLVLAARLLVSCSSMHQEDARISCLKNYFTSTEDQDELFVELKTSLDEILNNSSLNQTLAINISREAAFCQDGNTHHMPEPTPTKKNYP